MSAVAYNTKKEIRVKWLALQDEHIPEAIHLTLTPFCVNVKLTLPYFLITLLVFPSFLTMSSPLAGTSLMLKLLAGAE